MTRLTIEVDDETLARWRKRASEQGLSVEDWITSNSIASAPADEFDPSELSNEEWQKRWQAFCSRARPTPTPLDVSRESMYD